MAIVSLTKRQVRTSLIKRVIPEQSYITGETASSATASAVAFSQLANLFVDDHFKGGWIRAVVGGTPETKKIASFTGSSCTVTPVSSFSGAPVTSNIEVIRADTSFNLLDEAIEGAMHAAARILLVDKMDTTSLCYQPHQAEYILPSGFARIDTVEMDHEIAGSDRFVPSWASYRATEQNFQATTTQYSQGILTANEWMLEAIFYPLRAIGSPDYTMIADVRSDTGGVPTGGAGGIVGSSVATSAASITTTRTWVRFTFTAPLRLAANTVYHLTLHPGTGTTINASNYYAWAADAPAGLIRNPASSADSGATWTAITDRSLGFRIVDAIRDDWRKLEVEEWRLPNNTQRTIIIEPDTMPLPPVPIRIRGQGSPTSIDGVANDGTTLDADPESILELAVGLYMEVNGSRRNDVRALQGALMLKKEALDQLSRTRPLPRGRPVERN